MGGDGVATATSTAKLTTTTTTTTTTAATSSPTPNDVSIMPTSSSVNSSPLRDDHHDSVLLGVQELERQMNKTNYNNNNNNNNNNNTSNIRKSSFTTMTQRDNPFDVVIPSYHRDDDTSDTTGNSSYPTSLEDRSSMKRKSSLKKFITTPLVRPSHESNQTITSLSMSCKSYFYSFPLLFFPFYMIVN